jgi:hypothetical protein
MLLDNGSVLEYVQPELYEEALVFNLLMWTHKD